VSTLNIPTAQVFEPLLQPARFKGAKGGRGSGKSHFFAELLIEECVDAPGVWGEGMLAVCIREVQRTLADSSKRLLESKLAKFGLGEADGFKVWKDRIEVPGDGVITFTGMQSHTADSIKSMEGFRRALWDEAQGASHRSLSILRPTLRAKGSELWFSWNPTRKNDAIEDLFVHKFDLLREETRKMGSDAICVTANWRDNPFFTDELELERQTELRLYPERYPHTWEGEYAQAFEGAYYAAHLATAKREGRIGKIAADPLLPVYAFWDIGGSRRQCRRPDDLDRAVRGPGDSRPRLHRGPGPDARLLRHRAARQRMGEGDLPPAARWPELNAVTGLKYKDHLEQAGFDVPEPTPNQGQGAAKQRIEAVRRLFTRIWFNERTTEGGRAALGFYHEKRDDIRGIGLGPKHDWSSHAADAFGLMAICYEEPSRVKRFNRPLVYPKRSIA
jgi:phage terminase large subunit